MADKSDENKDYWLKPGSPLYKAASEPPLKLHRHNPSTDWIRQQKWPEPKKSPIYTSKKT